MIKKAILATAKLRLLKIFYLLFVFLIGTFAFFVYLKSQEASEALAISQAKSKQSIIVRSASSAIETFLKQIQYETTTLGKESMSIQDPIELQKTYQQFIDSFENTPVIGIFRLDKNGKLILIVNVDRNKAGEGEDFSDRPYFIAAQDVDNRNHVFITDPFISRAGASNGKYILVSSYPLYNKNDFDGLFGIVILLDKLQETYVSPLRTEKFARTFILDSQGDVIASEDTQLVGTNIFNYGQLKQWDGYEGFIQEVHRILDGSVTEGSSSSSSSRLTFQYLEDNEPYERVFTFRKIRAGDTQWTLFVETKKAVAFLITNKLEYGLLFWLITTIIVIFVSGIFIVFITHAAYREGYLRCHADIREKEKKD